MRPDVVQLPFREAGHAVDILPTIEPAVPLPPPQRFAGASFPNSRDLLQFVNARLVQVHSLRHYGSPPIRFHRLRLARDSFLVQD